MKRYLSFLFFTIILPLACFVLIIFIAKAMNGWLPSQSPATSATSTPIAKKLMPIAVAQAQTTPGKLFPIESVDTMKDSRDGARMAETDQTYEHDVIDKDISLIAATGATHVAIDTPYDQEFIPILREWVTAARAQGLSVWFRGNFSGWEGWFGYSSISRSDHIDMIKAFITGNPDLFRDGDIFTACPECENGGPGDPRMTGDVSGHRQFLLAEQDATVGAFASIGKNVDSDITSMNDDVAKLVMDPATAKALGGVVAIDDYTHTPQELSDDIKTINASSGAKVIIGEFGAPIPDLNGDLTDAEQSDFVEGLLAGMYYDAGMIAGVNYWVIRGGTTALAQDDGTPKTAYKTLELYYSAKTMTGVMRDSLGIPVTNTRLLASQVPSDTVGYPFTTDSHGDYTFYYPHSGVNIYITDPSGTYDRYTLNIDSGMATTTNEDLVLETTKPSLWQRFLKFVKEVL